MGICWLLMLLMLLTWARPYSWKLPPSAMQMVTLVLTLAEGMEIFPLKFPVVGRMRSKGSMGAADPDSTAR